MKTMIKKIGLILVLSFLSGIANTQIVIVPDVNFKNKLILLGIDTNFDGDIQVTEALVPTNLNLNASNINNLTGIEAFVNLQNLFCESNQLTNLDVASLSNLQNLFCSDNQLTNLNLIGLTDLQTLSCTNNQLTNLDVSTLANLQNFNCDNNQLVSLNLTGSPNLEKLTCNENQLTSLNVTGLTNLDGLSCHTNQLTNLDLSTLINLQTLTCYSNQLTNLSVTALSNLQYFACHFNLLTNLDASNLANLENLLCYNNQLTSLNVSNLANLQSLLCHNNLLTVLNVSTLTNLQLLNCANNQISALDVSALTNLRELDCSTNQLVSLAVDNLTILEILSCGTNLLTNLDLSNTLNIENLNCDNNQLTSLFLKNGITELVSFSGNPTLAYICVDQSEILAIQDLAINYGYTNCLVNSYCSITPGGDYNTVSGTVIFDENNNGCTATDPILKYIQVGVDDGANTDATYTSTSGIHNVYTEVGSFDFSLNMENPNYFSISPVTANVVFGNDDNNLVIQDFCVTAIGVMNDLEVVLAPIIPAIPGSDAAYELVYKNKGNQTLSGNVVFTYNDDVLDIVSTSIPEDAQSTGSLTWNFLNLLPFEIKTITINLNVNSSLETPPVNVDDLLPFTVAINPLSIDAFPLDNSFSFSQIVVDDSQPNEVECLEGEEVTPNYIGEYLHYVIRFENTLNNPAEFVVVKTDVNPDEFDIRSLQILSSSHEFYARTVGDQVEFIFENIDLAALQGDEGGHGHIILKLQSTTDLEINDTVSKMANVFYDFNSPFVTNDAHTVIKPFLAEVSELYKDDQVLVYPNPTKNKLNIVSKVCIDDLQILDLTGKVMFAKTSGNMIETIDINDFAEGIYILQLTSEHEVIRKHIVKE